MSRFLHRFRDALRGYARSEQGNVTVEFVIIMPLYLLILFASFEAGYATSRQAMLDRALDMTVRDLRIGALGLNPEHEDVRDRMCYYSLLIPNCLSTVMLEMRVIDRSNWTGFTTSAICVDRREEVNLPPGFVQGVANDVVTIRACAVFDPFFPSTSLGLGLRPDETGGYQLAATSAFVNEPWE